MGKIMPTSTENLETNSNIVKSEAKVELKNQLFSLSPNLFEKLVVDLIQRMGYGSYQGNGVICKSGDDGIDGIVYQDPTNGIFFTTTDFESTNPELLNESTEDKLVVNGDQLVDLLIEYEVGIESVTAYKVHRNYFQS
jgi:restriction system protein